MRSIFLVILSLFILTVSAAARNGVPVFASGERAGLRAPVQPGTRTLNSYQSDRLAAYLNGAAAPLDTLRLIAIQVQFADSLFGGPGSHRPELRDSLYFSNELKHLRDYYRGASQGKFQIEWDLLGTVLTLPEGMNYYGDDAFEEQRVVEMVQEIITAVDASVDFSKYHSVFVIHAGAGQETDSNDNSRGQLWSSFYDFDDIEAAFPDSAVSGLATNDLAGGEPFFVDNFIIAPSNPSQDITTIGSLGIWAFEIGSRIGLLSLSDSTPRGFPDSRGVGYFCLMSYGLYAALAIVPTFPCTFNRILAGWIEPYEVTSGGTFRLKDINSTIPVDTACLKIPINESEYYLVVNRVHDTNFDSLFTFVNLDTACLTPDNVDSLGGAEFDFFLTDLTNPYTIGIDPGCPDYEKRFVDTGSGVYIWHVDERVILENLASGHLPNDFVHRKGVDLEEADGIQDLDTAGGAITLGGYFDSFRLGHNTLFGPDTDPASTANGGAKTGITVEVTSEPATFMNCSISFSSPYGQTVTTWPAAGAGQSPVPVDLNGDNRNEIMILADSAGVFVFEGGGAEFYDWDGDPATIEPYIPVAGVAWAGPAAFGPIDDLPGGEIVAAGKNGVLYAWRGDGTEVFDGDANSTTSGVLDTGSDIAAPPLLLDVDGDGRNDIAVARIVSDSLIIGFVNWRGEAVVPYNAAFEDLWPVRLQAQLCASLTYGHCGDTLNRTGGIVISWVDTLDGRSGLTYVPLSQQASPFSERQRLDMTPGGSPQRETSWSIELERGRPTDTQLLTLLPPAAGDLDLDGFDEVALVLPEGTLVIHDNSPAGGQEPTTKIVDLRAVAPSAPALGDIDRNGTLEIALFDSEYFYLFAGNGSPLTDWPRPRYERRGIERPPAPDDIFAAAPLLGDIDGDERTEVMFVTYDGTAHAFRGDGGTMQDFPRPVPSGVLATPALIDFDGTGVLSLAVAGHVASLDYRDAVSDTLITRDVMSLALQELPGTAGRLFWRSDRNGALRWGRAVSGMEPPVTDRLAEENTALLYPNPVTGGGMNVRIIVNKSAALGLVVYNLEGENALTRDFGTVNPGGLAGYIVDERIDVSSLKSGLYFARISVRGTDAAEVIIKPFAIKR